MRQEIKRISKTGRARSVLVVLMAAMAMGSRSARADFVEDWGNNFRGQLGNGTTASSNTPVAVSPLSSGVSAIAAGGSHSLAIQNGGVWAWGYNGEGQLGNGSIDNNSHSTPVAISGALSSGATAIAAGGVHSLAIQNGGVYAWGDNTAGELGNGTNVNSSTPVAISGTLSSGVTAIAAGAGTSVAIQNGGVWAWGSNGSGELGNGTSDNNPHSTPAAISGTLSSGVTAIAAGADHDLAIQNGALYAWGGNSTGQLGNGTTTEENTPVAVSTLTSGVTAIAAGDSDSLAVQNGNVYAWGNNGNGQLGDGNTTESKTPIQIDPADLTNITAVAAAEFSSYALSADGSLWVWGYNGNGELGLGTNTMQYDTPQHLLPPSGYAFTSIDADADGDHAIATLTATPEPASLALLAFAGIATLQRRRRRHGSH